MTDSSSFPSNGNDQADAAAQTIQSCWRKKRKRDVAKEAAHATAKALTTKREAGVLPKAVIDLMERIEISDEGASASNITSMTVIRTPVEEYVSHLMQIISIGKYKEAIAESPYDGMFHLSILLNGRYTLQKNEVICLVDKVELTEKSETVEVEIPAAQPLTFAMLLENTKRHMGCANFTDYCAKTNNCQDFILAVLRGNGLATAELEAFVKQDAEGIFNQLPVHTAPVAKALTDSAAIANKLAEDIMVKSKTVDYSAMLDEFKGKVPDDKLEEASKVMKELKLSASEAKGVLKSDERKRDKFSQGLRLLREKRKSKDKVTGGVEGT